MLNTAPALDALFLIDDALALDGADRALRADLLAGMGQAPLAGVGDTNLLGRAGVAGKGDDVDQRRIVVFGCNGALGDAVADRRMLRNGPDRQADGKAQPLRNDGALKEDIFTVFGNFTGNDLVGQGGNTGIIPAFISSRAISVKTLLRISLTKVWIPLTKLPPIRHIGWL